MINVLLVQCVTETQLPTVSSRVFLREIKDHEELEPTFATANLRSARTQSFAEIGNKNRSLISLKAVEFPASYENLLSSKLFTFTKTLETKIRQKMK